MIGGLMFGLKFDRTDYVVTALLCLGLIFFTQADAQSTSDFNIVGVLLMTLSVSTDAFRLNLSERVMNNKSNPRSVGELV